MSWQKFPKRARIGVRDPSDSVLAYRHSSSQRQVLGSLIPFLNCL